MNETPTLPGFGKRILSHAIDLFVVFLTGFLLFASVTSTFFFNAIGGAINEDRAFRFLGDSGLFSISEQDGLATGYTAKSYTANSSAANESSPAQTERGYVLYLHDCYEFYVSFLPSDSRVSPVKGSDGSTIPAKDYYTPEYFYTSVMGLPDPATVTITDEASRAGNNPYFMYALTTDNTALDLTAEPVLTSGWADKVAAGKGEDLTTLKNYFYLYLNNVDSGLFVTAVNLALADPYYSSNFFSFNLKLWAAFALPVAPLILLDFLVLPLVDKKGRTVGKMITGLAVADSTGAHLHGWRKVPHPLLVTFEVLLALIYPLGIGLLAFLFVSMVDYTSAVVSKSHLSFHEKIARTLVIVFKKSSKHVLTTTGPNDREIISELPSCSEGDSTESHQPLAEKTSAESPTTTQNADSAVFEASSSNGLEESLKKGHAVDSSLENASPLQERPRDSKEGTK